MKRSAATATVAAGILLALLVVVCSTCGEPEKPPTPVTPTVIDPATTGRIIGTVKLDRATLERPIVARGGDSFCAALKPALSETVIINDHHVQNAFVWIKSGLGDRVFMWPTSPAEINQTACTFVPHVVGVMKNQTVRVKTSDATSHDFNTKVDGHNARAFAFSAAGQSRDTWFPEPVIGMTGRCGQHAWMSVQIHVVDHPFFGVTGADGRFELTGVPAGDYILGCWNEHPLIGQQDAKATVTAAGTATVDFNFKLKD